jgi:predicted Zn finger-like uncharacterized protein
MLIVCPNCATSYGVEMASLRPARGRTRKLRCHRCRFVWQANLSDTDKLLVAADAVPPVRRALAAIAQAAADAARSALPRLQRATAILADELEAARTRADRAPIRPEGPHAEPADADLAGVTVTRVIEGISAIAARVAGALSGTSPGCGLGARLGGSLGARHCHACSASFSDLRLPTRRLSASVPMWSGPCRKPHRFMPRSVYR